MSLTSTTHIAVIDYLIESGISKEAAINYAGRVVRDFEDLTPELPRNVSRVVEISSSWGYHSLTLGEIYKERNQKPLFILIDGTEEIKKKSTGYRDKAQPYRDGRIGCNLLRRYGYEAIFYPVGKKTSATVFSPVDLIMSFCAYGHHFPISTYLPLVMGSLKPHGHLLLDIRAGTDGIHELGSAGFAAMRLIRKKDKYARILFQKDGV